MRRMFRFASPAGLALSLILFGPALQADEPPAEDLTITIEKAASEAAEAAQQVAVEIVEEAQRAASEAAADVAEEAQEVAKEVAEEAAEAARHVVELAGEQRIVSNLTIGYQLNLNVTPVPPALDAQLKLEGKGVLVDRVAENGPAAKAGIQPLDVLVAVNDQPISNAKDLMKVVHASEGKALRIKLLRGGQSQEVTATPEKSAESTKIIADLRIPSEEVEIEIHKLEGKIREKLKDAGLDVRMQLMRPGHIMPPNTFVAKTKIPDDVSITVTKQGEAPAKIEISKGDKKWSATEDKLGELPDEVRPFAERMLGRLPAPPPLAVPFGPPGDKKFTVMFDPRGVMDPEMLERVREEAKRARQDAERVREDAHKMRLHVQKELKESVRGTVERRLDAMSREMEKMSRQMEELRRHMRDDSETEEREEINRDDDDREDKDGDDEQREEKDDDEEEEDDK